MSVLRNLESKIAGLVEGTFSRAFKTEVRPVELARRLEREMDGHRTVSLSRTYVPNEYVVYLSPDDRERYVGVEREVSDELAAHLLEHARREKLALVTRPTIEFETDERLSLGEFGIAVRKAAPPVAEEHDGDTMVQRAPARQEERRSGRAFIVAEGKRLAVPAAGAVVGRSRDCDVVLADTNVSRRHAELRPSGGGWTIADLGSTNGVRVNGQLIHGATAIGAGDDLRIGTVDVRFEVG